MILSQLLHNERRRLSRGDGSSYEKTYSQLISNNNFKEKGRLGSGDKTTATHERTFTLTLLVFLRNIFLSEPLFSVLNTIPALILITLITRTTNFTSFTKSILICGHLSSLMQDRRKREKKKVAFRFSACCWLSGT